MSDEHIDETTGELLPATVHTNRAVDLRDRATDSWTDVLDDVITLARGIANTEFVPKGLRGSMEKTSAAILYSRELGLEPLTGLGSVHVIEGKAGISAEMMRALVLRAGHELAIKRSDRSVCEIWGRRKGTEEWTKATFTMDEANQTQVFISKEKGWGPLSAKSQWRSWPAEMLLARATTRLVRMIFPDVAHGMRTAEELQDMTMLDAEGMDAPPVQEPIRRQPKASQESGRKRVARPAPKKQEPAEETTGEAETVEETTTEPEAPADPVSRSRTRTARPAPRPAPASEPVKKPEPEAPAGTTVETLPEDDAEPVDAEIVDDEPAKDEPEELPEASRKAIALVQMHFNRLEVTDRAERLWITGQLTGRAVTTTKQLNLDELRGLVTVLERCKDMGAVNARLDAKRLDGES